MQLKLFRTWCTKLCTDKDSQQRQSSFHIQTEPCHIGIMPLFMQDRSGVKHLKIIVFISFQFMSGSNILKESNKRSSSVFKRLESSDNVGLAFNHILRRIFSLLV